KPCACLFDVAPDGGYRVSPCQDVRTNRTPYGEAVSVRRKRRPPDRLVSVALFLGLAHRQADAVISGRLLAVILPCGVRTFLEAVAPRLPGPPCYAHFTSRPTGLRG